MIKARFKIQMSDKKILPPRYPAAASRQTPENRLASETTTKQPLSKLTDIFSSGVELRLEDEIPARELNRFAACILKCHAMMKQPDSSAEILASLLCDARCGLSSLTQLKNEYEENKIEKTKHISLTKKLIEATQPLIDNDLIPEKEKNTLLEAITLAAEKMTQLKMRQTNLASRIQFIKKATPVYLSELGNKMNSSKEVCSEIFQLTETTLNRD